MIRESWEPAGVPEPRQERLPATEDRAALRTQRQLDALKPGSAIRLYSLDGSYVSGSYDGRDSAHARVASDSSIVVPIENIIAMERRRPVTGQFGRKGLVVGALAGALGFGLPAAINCRERKHSTECDPLLASVLISFGVVSASYTGFIISSLYGSVTKQWQPYQ
jgi:hypothetical protein